MQDSFICYMLVTLTAAWDLQSSKKQTKSINNSNHFNVVNDTCGECATPSLSCKLCIVKHGTQHIGPVCPSEWAYVRDLYSCLVPMGSHEHVLQMREGKGYNPPQIPFKSKKVVKAEKT